MDSTLALGPNVRSGVFLARGPKDPPVRQVYLRVSPFASRVSPFASRYFFSPSFFAFSWAGSAGHPPPSALYNPMTAA